MSSTDLELIGLLSEVLEPEDGVIRERVTEVDEDGWIFDIHSGEVLGHAQAEEKFAADTLDKAEWCLKLLSDIDGGIVGDQAQLAALQERLNARINAKLRRRSWWEWKFAPSLIEFAKDQLAGKKERTARFSWGSVAFRTTSGTNQIVSMPEAVEWMRAWAPERIKTVTTETVTVKDVLRTIREVAAKFDEEPEAPGWLKQEGAGENVNITTGIDLTPKKEKKL